MAAVTDSILIRTLPGNAWAILADLTTIQYYDPLVSKAFYLTDRREGIGVSRQCDLVGGGFVRERIVEWQPISQYGIRVFTDSDPNTPFVQQVVYFTLSPVAEGTIVTMRFEYLLVDDPALDPAMIAVQCQEMVTGLLGELKVFIESLQPGALEISA